MADFNAYQRSGQSQTDNILRAIVYPSYDSPVMIVSYTCSQDASRMAALTAESGDSESEGAVRRDAAIELCLEALCEIHGKELVMSKNTGKLLCSRLVWRSLHAGAFAKYGPSC